jgi:NNP family nitrate/nitrite transporter-like MFS transporter
VIAWRVWREGVVGDSGLVVALLAIASLLALQLTQVFRVNRPARRDEYPMDDRYPLRTVAALCVAYFCTFGSELAVVTMLPDFFAGTWALGPAMAGAAASAFAFMNLVARPMGGIFSDVLGSRKRTLGVLLVGLAVGYGLMSLVGSAWPVPVAIAVCMVCSFFVQSGEGAVYAIVPIVKKRVSGQIAGMAGAYGNVGAICFLTSRLWLSDQAFFLLIGAASVVAIAVNALIVEPAHSFSAQLLVDTQPTEQDDRVAAPEALVDVRA